MKNRYLPTLFFIAFPLFAWCQDVAVVTLNINDYKSDSVYAEVIFNKTLGKKEMIKFDKQGNVFRASVPVDNSTYLTITDGKNTIEGVIEAGDNVVLSYGLNKYYSTWRSQGKGSSKFNIFFDNTNAYNNILKEKLSLVKAGQEKLDNYYALVDSVEESLMKKLDKAMFGISTSSYSMIKGEIKGTMLLSRYAAVEEVAKTHLEALSAKTSLNLNEKNKATLVSLSDFPDSYYLSPRYLHAVFYILSKEFETICSSKKTASCLKDRYNYFDKKLTGQLKVPVQTMLLLSEMDKEVDQHELYSLIIRTFDNNSTSEYKPYLMNAYSKFRVGKKAPEFFIEGLDGGKIALSNYKGKVVYVNFWFSGHSGCQTLFSKLKVVKEHFAENNDMVFLSVSIDSKELWKRTVKYYGIKGENGFTEGKGMDHPIIGAYKVDHFPTSFVIDRKGNFYDASPSENPLQLINLLDNALKEQLVMGKVQVENKAAKN